MGATRSLTSPLRTRARYTGAVRRRLRLHGSHGQFDRWIEPALSGRVVRMRRFDRKNQRLKRRLKGKLIISCL